MTDTVVAWLEAEFEQRYAKLAAVREATKAMPGCPDLGLEDKGDDHE